MEKFDYSEELVISAGLNTQISSQIFLIDLLRIEYFEELRHDFAIFYLRELSKKSGFQVSSTLEDLAPMRIILLPNWTLLVHLTEIYCISTQPGSLSISRANLKKFCESQNMSASINTVELCQPSCFSYVSVNLCKFFLQSFVNIEELLGIDQFESFIQDAREDLAKFIYACSRLPAKTLLLKMNEAKELMQSVSLEYEEYDEEGIFEGEGVGTVEVFAMEKPVCEILVYGGNRSLAESLEYTQSESTGRAETSFRLSNTITGRFPRLSGSSIALMETPSKETKKSYGEYLECMDSPRLSSFHASPLTGVASTPIFSPRQAAYTIQEVKNFLITKRNCEKESPYGKGSARKTRNGGVKPLSFQDTDTKSPGSELGSSREFGKGKTTFEEQKVSCRCQSCLIF